MAVKKISKVQPEKFEFNKKNKETKKQIFYPNGLFPIKYNNQNINDISLDEMESYWQDAKKLENS